MFFIKVLTHTILAHPSYFGPKLHEHIETRLHADVQDVGNGIVLPGNGQAEFIITYKAVVFKPFKGEVLDGVVTQVLKMGFFVEVGPLRCFVSQQLVHADMRFDPNSNPPSFTSPDQVIEKDTKVRLKVVGTRVDQTEIFAIATIKEDHLGVID